MKDGTTVTMKITETDIKRHLDGKREVEIKVYHQDTLGHVRAQP
jgi:hypothetical protein